RRAAAPRRRRNRGCGRCAPGPGRRRPRTRASARNGVIAVTSATTDNAVLGGRITLRQPRRGHRVDHDAILLAAGTAAKAGEHAVDLGAGVGSAGIALAARVRGLNVTLVEIEPALTALAEQNVRRNQLADRVRAVTFDALAPAERFVEAGLP